MQIRTQGRVAINAILDIAVHGANKPVSLADVSERQGVSQSYLEQLFQKLRQQGLVASFRGRGGGYQLNRGLATISVADVINTVDGASFACVSSNDGERCSGTQACLTNGLWCRVNDYLHDHLRTVSLESVLAESHVESAPLRHKDQFAAAIV
jgi:Rrf2 family iron-sulfur cluster assembly transcriptional regulator